MKLQVFGLLYGSAPLTLIVMAITAIIYAWLAYRLVCAVVSTLVGLSSILGVILALICAGFVIYCLVQMGLAATVMFRAVVG